VGLEQLETDVVVIGAGPAGVAAASDLAAGGRDVLLVDEAPRPGGQIWRHQSDRDLPVAAHRWLNRLMSSAAEVLSGTSVIDVDGDGDLIAQGARHVYRIRASTIVLATGARELFLPFPGWTLPGVVGVGGGQALVKSGVEVDGLEVVLAGSGPLLLPVAALLAERGARVRLIAEQAPPARVWRFGAGLWRQPRKVAEAIAYRRRSLAATYRLGVWATAAFGEDKVREVELTNGRRTWRERCDLLCCAYGLIPNTELAQRLGCRVAWQGVEVDGHQQTSREGVYCVGEATGVGGADLSLLEGQIVAAHLTEDRRRLSHLMSRRRRQQRFVDSLAATFTPRSELRQRVQPETIVCRCEDVRWQDLEVHWSPRQAKLYTRLGMGPCQARICGAAMHTLAGWAADSVRPPLRSCRIGSLIR
jgi:NADPH-dependent 2,4-dienoyl-CoA reductase/sulfur reductase-like enzyme